MKDKERKIPQEIKNKFNDLKKHEGEIVLYQRGKRKIEMELVLVTTEEERSKTIGGVSYGSYPYEIRLNYIDRDGRGGWKGYWSGFWTRHIDKIYLSKQMTFEELIEMIA
jgi:hypothetical protein